VITEEHHTGVVAFGGVCQQVKEGIVVRKEVPGVTGLRTDHVRTLDGVAAKEDGKVETDDVVVSLPGVELDSKSTRVTSLVWILTANGNGGKTNKDGCLLANTRQEVGFLRQLAQYLEY
jgi:hypothetical protein